MGKIRLIRIPPDAAIAQLKHLAMQRFNLPDIELDLVYEEQHITGKLAKIDGSTTVRAAGIPNNGRLSCVATHREFSELVEKLSFP